MNLLDDSTVESMLRDARTVERSCSNQGPAYGMERDLCCHIKALASDREELRRMVMEQRAKAEKLNNERVAANAVTGQQIGPMPTETWNGWVPAEHYSALVKIRQANSWKIQRLHDATIVLRNAIGQSRCREELRSFVDEANRLIEMTERNDD